MPVDDCHIARGRLLVLFESQDILALVSLVCMASVLDCK